MSDSETSIAVAAAILAGIRQESRRLRFGRHGAAAYKAGDDVAMLLATARAYEANGRPTGEPWRQAGELAVGSGRCDPRRCDAGHPHAEHRRSEDALRARLVLADAFDAARAGDWSLARAHFGAAGVLFDRAGERGDGCAARVRAHWVTICSGVGGARVAAAARVELDAELATARELLTSEPGSTTPVAYLTALRTAMLVARSVDPDGGAAAVERLRAEAKRLGVPFMLADALHQRGLAACQEGATAVGMADLREAISVLRYAALPWRLPGPLVSLSQELLERGDAAEALGLLQEALALHVSYQDPWFNLARAQALLGEAHAACGDLAHGIRLLYGAAERHDRDRLPGDAAETRLRLARVLRGAGQLAEAVAVLETQLLDAAELTDQTRVCLRLELAGDLSRLGEHRAAADEYVSLAAAAAGWPDRYAYTQVCCAAALALAEAGRLDEARAASARALASHRVAPRPREVTAMLRELVGQLMDARGADGADDALALLDEADGIIARTHPSPEFHPGLEAGLAAYRRGEVLAAAGRPRAAMAQLDVAVASFAAADVPCWHVEAALLAGTIEAYQLDQYASALARLDAEAAWCTGRDVTPDLLASLATLRARIAARSA